MILHRYSLAFSCLTVVTITQLIDITQVLPCLLLLDCCYNNSTHWYYTGKVGINDIQYLVNYIELLPKYQENVRGNSGKRLRIWIKIFSIWPCRLDLTINVNGLFAYLTKNFVYIFILAFELWMLKVFNLALRVKFGLEGQSWFVLVID